MRNTFKKTMSLILVFVMLLGFLPITNTSMAISGKALPPVTENGVTTFSYQGDETTKVVKLPGSFNGWNVDATELSKGEGNLFTTQVKLQPGKYQYKFHVDGEWMPDPNLELVVKGLKVKAGSLVEAGSSIELNSVFVDETGSENSVDASFTLEKEIAGVSVSKKTLTVSKNVDVNSVIVVAKYNGYEAKHNIEISKGLNKFIVNYKRNDNTHMNWDMWVWGNGVDGSAYGFNEEVDGYARGTIETPLSEISVITRPKSWDTQEVTRTVTMPEGQNEVEVWIVQGDETVYYSKLGDQQTLHRNILLNYDRPNKDYKGWDLWVWSSGLSDGSNRFDENGKVRFNISNDATNVGFKIHKIVDDNAWAEVDQDFDRIIATNPDALEKTTKVYAIQGQGEFRQIPYLNGPTIKNHSITFYYRDIDLYDNLESDKLESVVINLSKRNLDNGEVTSIGSFEMVNNKLNEYFEYTAENLESNFDYIYTFDATVDGKKTEDILDIYNTIGDESYVRLRDAVINVKANASAESVEAGNSIVISVEIDNPDNETIKSIYIDGKALGLGKIDVSTKLLKQSIAIPHDHEKETVELDVVVVDNFDGKHIGKVSFEVLPNTDTEETIDWDEEIIYFMLTDRFSDGDTSNNALYGEKLDKNHLEAYHGGDFQGIIDNVDYLKKLGITTVWITPIVDNIDDNLRANVNDKQYGYHGYWAKDFTSIESGLGNVEKLKEMIDVLHDNGIKLMIDVVLNHSGYNTEKLPVFAGMLRENSGTNDFTMKLSGLPDFKTEENEVREKLVKWQSQWLEKLVTDKGNTVDYYRVDTVKHVDKETWKSFKNALVEIKPDFKLIGEYYGASVDTNGGYLGDGMMDSVLDFEFKSLAEKFVKGDIETVENRLKYRNENIDANETLGLFLSSHDEDGFLISRISGNKNLLKVAASLQMTAKGQPVIYYGEEIGMSGLNANFDIGRYGENRKSFDWNKVENNDLLEHYKKITNIRKENATIFSRGDRKSLYSDEAVSVFSRSYNGKTIIVGLNTSNEAKTIKFNFDKTIGNKLQDIYGNEAFEAASGKATITIPANAQGGTVVLIPETDESIKPELASKVIVHFDNPNNEAWSLWIWPDGGNGAQYEFTSKDDFGQVAEIVFDGKYDKIGLIIKGTSDWSKNVNGDRFVNLTDEVTHVWLRDKDEKVYLEKPLRLDQEPLTITDFLIDSFTELNVKVNKNISLEDFKEDYDLTVNGESIKDKVQSITVVDGTDEQTKQIKFIFKEDINLEETIHLTANLFDGKGNVDLEADSKIGKVITDPKFDELFYYDGTLGAIYSEDETEFKLWAPTSKEVNLLIYKNGTFEAIPMTKGDKGVYSYKLSGNQLGTEYMYEVHVGDKVNKAVDPYAKAVTVNGQRGVVTNPKPTEVERPTGVDMQNPIIYELHIRDYSIAENSGMENKGKFLALTEEKTKADNGQITGIDYLDSLGVTHIQILPMYDYASVNEKSDKPQFNWGYDPQNYNAVEGSYSTDATQPFLRIKELQQTIDKIHNKNMGVIMDVVYNHVFDPARHSFEYIVPGYYFRQDDKGGFLGGTGVGNETASERKMMRKFIIDSTKYWVETFKLDGLRFDLMGTHDYETMNMVYQELFKINPNIFILGEGWNMDMGIPEDLRATQKNAAKMPDLAFFSDDIRDGIKGSVFTGTDPGFVNGKKDQESYIMQNIKGGQGLQGYVSASQVVQYVEAHDNLTLWDKLEITNPNDGEETRLKMHKLATSIVMLAHGTPFIHAGQEWARTKGGDHNSYMSPDSVNQFDWDRVLKYKDNVDYFRQLIKIRKGYDVFNLKEYSQINEVFEEIAKSNDLVAYKLENGDKDLYIAHNANRQSTKVEVENGIYKVLVRDQKANSEGLDELEVKDGIVEVAPLSTLVLVQKTEEDLGVPSVPVSHKGYIMYASNIRKTPNGEILGTLEFGDFVEGVVNSENPNWVEFEYNGEKAYVHKTLVNESLKPYEGYVLYDLNGRDAKGEIVNIVPSSTHVKGLYDPQNPSRLNIIYKDRIVNVYKAYVFEGLGWHSGHIIYTTNVRDSVSGNIVDTLKFGDFAEGVISKYNPNWIIIKYKGTAKYVYKSLIYKNLKAVKGYVLDASNVRDLPTTHPVAVLTTGSYVSGYMSPDYDGWIVFEYNNRVRHIHSSLVHTEIEAKLMGRVISDTNVRRSPNGEIVGVLKANSSIYYLVDSTNPNWVIINYNNTRRYIYKDLVK